VLKFKRKFFPQRFKMSRCTGSTPTQGTGPPVIQSLSVHIFSLALRQSDEGYSRHYCSAVWHTECLFLFMKLLKCGLFLRYEQKYNMDTFMSKIYKRIKKLSQFLLESDIVSLWRSDHKSLSHATSTLLSPSKTSSCSLLMWDPSAPVHYCYAQNTVYVCSTH
jgi:hypothetical protein